MDSVTVSSAPIPASEAGPPEALQLYSACPTTLNIEHQKLFIYLTSTLGGIMIEEMAVPMATGVSSHQLVGYVTKMYPTFGYINNEIFFQRKCVIGPMVDVGDNVAASAIYQPHMPIKWSAEKVWRVEERNSRSKDRDELWSSHSTRKHSSSPDRESKRLARDLERPDSTDNIRADKKRISSHSESVHSDKSSITRKKRTLSPERQSTRSVSPSRSSLHVKFMLNSKELLTADLQSRYSTVLPPVDLYRVKCHWQESFPLLRPYCPNRFTSYQILGRAEDTSEPLANRTTDDSFYANVLLFSTPSMNELMEKIVVRAESPGHTRGSIRKYVKILTAGRGNGRFKAIGGPWCPELDGPDPVTNPQTLINTAIRTCKEQIGLDLSYCSQWHRFLEFRYSRTEGSTAQPPSVLFPGSELWGRHQESAPMDPNLPNKPFHQIAVYFLPDVWSIMPTEEEWRTLKSACEAALHRKEFKYFPLSPMEIKKFSEVESSGADRDVSKLGSEVSTSTGSRNDPITEKQKGHGQAAEKNESAQDPDSKKMTTGPDSTSQTGEDHTSSTFKKPADPEDVAQVQKKSHTELNVSGMKVSELREQLKVRNLPIDGVKAQLVSRLKTAVDEEAEAQKAEQERLKKEKSIAGTIQSVPTPCVEESSANVSRVDQESKMKTEQPRIILRDYPAIVVQRKQAVDFHLQSVGLDVIMDTKSDCMDARAYEFIFCVHTFFEMLRRDAIFTLFRALVTAGERGVRAKPRKRGEPDYASKRARLEHPRKPEDTSTKDQMLYTTDLPLLFACTLLDKSCKSFFYSSEVESFIISLGLPVSRYQLRSLVSKVSEDNRIHYRSLTDSEEPLSLTNESTVIFSDIDDDEYLLELIRGGDAIFDEQIDTAIPLGSIVLLRQGISGPSGSSPPSENLFQQLRISERDRSKLELQIRLQDRELTRLKDTAKEMKDLKEKLTKTMAYLDDYRHRYKSEREKVANLVRVLDKQASVLDTVRSSLRSASNRARDRHEADKSTSGSTSTPVKESESKSAVTDEKSDTKAVNHLSSPIVVDESVIEDAEQVEKPVETPTETEKTLTTTESVNGVVDKNPVKTNESIELIAEKA